jgi:hypothetical protein
MRIETVTGSEYLRFLSYVLGVKMPSHWPHCVGGAEVPEEHRVRVHFLRWLPPSDLQYAESRIAGQLPMSWALSVTCAEPPSQCKWCKKPIADDTNGFCNLPGDPCWKAWVAHGGDT